MGNFDHRPDKKLCPLLIYCPNIPILRSHVWYTVVAYQAQDRFKMNSSNSRFPGDLRSFTTRGILVIQEFWSVYMWVSVCKPLIQIPPFLGNVLLRLAAVNTNNSYLGPSIYSLSTLNTQYSGPYTPIEKYKEGPGFCLK